MGTPRASAISALTLALGSTPPCPGLAPCDNLISIILTCGELACWVKRSGSKCPSAVRQPKYPEAICQIKSPPCSRWWVDMLPSPVSCANRPKAAPRFRAFTALGDKAPKLMPEMLSMDSAYGCWQPEPPTPTRKLFGSGCRGCNEWAIHSVPGLYMSLMLPKPRLSFCTLDLA